MDIDKNNPEQWLKKLQDMKEFIYKSKNEFNSIYKYCWGCNKYVKFADGYESRVTLETDDCEHIIQTPAIRCKNCGKVLKFLD